MCYVITQCVNNYIISLVQIRKLKIIEVCVNIIFKIVLEEKNIVIKEKNLISRIF